MIILKNETLTATIATKGAELQQLINRQTGINYLWSGNAAYWSKYSPVLFPIVGGLKNDTYQYKGQSYQLPRHGFAREKEFIAQQLNDSEAVFTLREDEQTKKVYPFSFVLKLRYQLRDGTLYCTYEVYNPAEEVLLFSIGGHPAFAVPLVNELTYTDYYLAFNKAEELNRWKIIDSLIATTAEPVVTQNNRLVLHPSLFYEDAIVLKQLKSNCITLVSDKNKHGLSFYFDDFPFFGIWAAKDAPFVCLEPWCGIGDSINHNQQLPDKEGINKLAPGESFSRTWSVACF
ncbi:MAG: aldose 1-epimerase family protein [Sphingobacteriales bacterium]|nr:aldose 1-epimerase family protein [Sphingobacteriales bacterium]MBI3719852.1 aldose 1-epimerase family protein [Sphingobacteriales bacterium]